MASGTFGRDLSRRRPMNVGGGKMSVLELRSNVCVSVLVLLVKIRELGMTAWRQIANGAAVSSSRTDIWC